MKDSIWLPSASDDTPGKPYKSIDIREYSASLEAHSETLRVMGLLMAAQKLLKGDNDRMVALLREAQWLLGPRHEDEGFSISEWTLRRDAFLAIKINA